MSIGIRFYIQDKTYGHGEDDWEQQSEAFKKQLETEYNLPFEYEDIGTGASAPAFFATLIDLAPYAAPIALFFAGKKIEENLDAWGKIYARLKKFLNRNPMLDMQGASVLAIHSITKSMGKVPTFIRLTGYYTESALNQPFEELCEDETKLTKINPPTRFTDSTIHVFQIEVDDRLFKIFLFCTEVKLLELK
jgi:hypothetical protein